MKKILVALLFVLLLLGYPAGVLADDISSEQLEEATIETDETANKAAQTEEEPKKTSSEPVLKNNTPEILDVKPISMQEFQDRVTNIFAQIITFARNIAAPYMYVGIIIGALILLLPFANPLKKYLGWKTIFTALVAYLIIWWGPVLLGLLRGFSEQ